MEIRLVTENFDREIREGGPKYTPVETENNDALDMSDKKNTTAKMIKAIGFKAEVILNREEAALIFFSLVEYKANLRRTETEAASFEDEMFLHEQLAKISKMQYELIESHEGENTKKVIQAWLDVV